MRYRPVAVPLITVDPFFSVWSCDDALYGGPTEHWCGKPSPIMAGIYVGTNLGNCSGEGSLAMVNVTDRTHVHVGLGALE